MIGKIHSQPHSYSATFSSWNNSTASTHSPLKNKFTGAIIHVQQIDADFRTIRKERALYREVKENYRLAAVADTDSHTSQHARLQSIGLAVTYVSNRGENGQAKEIADNICNNNPRNQNVDIKFDKAINKRGQGFIQDVVKNRTPLDATNYATGLRVGSDM